MQVDFPVVAMVGSRCYVHTSGVVVILYNTTCDVSSNSRVHDAVSRLDAADNIEAVLLLRNWHVIKQVVSIWQF